jgi:ferritin-like metal-binding protein YciE
MSITSLQGFLVYELGEVYNAEHRFLEEQVRMVHRATDGDLQRTIESHIRQTRQHIGNLEQFYRELGQEPHRETNEAAQGLMAVAEQSIGEAQSDALRDCAINTAIVKVEHFEIGSYRGLIAGARLMMGESVAVSNLLEANLQQEEETARTAEQSAEELLQKAMRVEAPEQEALADKISRFKDRLTGQ